MKKKYFIFLCFVGQKAIFAQQFLPIIKATSHDVDVRDGLHFRKAYWYLMPKVKPDIYYVELPQKNNTVTFHTDLDSLSFQLKTGENRDFIIVLNEKDTCFTRILSEIKPSPTCLNFYNTRQNDTISFKIRRNRIYFEGKINQLEKAVIQFDLGAGSGCIRRKALSEKTLFFDEKGFLSNSNGKNEVRISNKNQVQLGNLTFGNVTFYETRNMKPWEDLILGNNLFLDKIVEINYHSKRLILHNELPKLDSSWQKMDMILDDGVRPVMAADLEIKGKKYHDWFLFDTGHTGNALVSKTMYERHDIYKKAGGFLRVLGRKTSKLNILIGKHHLDNKIVVFDQYHIGEFSLLGNKILRKFNAILDNRNGFLYLKPNNL